MTDIIVRRRRAQSRARTGPLRLHIVSFRFTSGSPFRHTTTVLVKGRMDQRAAMSLAADEARKRGPDPWLTDVRTVRPLRPTPVLDAICREHTAFTNFLALLTQPALYRPSIRLDLMGRHGVVLAREYDRVQALWGDPRRAFVSGDLPAGSRVRGRISHAPA